MIRTAQVNGVSVHSTTLKSRIPMIDEELWEAPKTQRALATTDLLRTLAYEQRVGHLRVGLTVQIEAALQELMRQGISLPEPSGVRRYLLKNPDLIALLKVVTKTAVRMFHDGSQLSLELYKDPEMDDEYLTIYVRQAYYDADILGRIEELSQLVEPSLADQAGWLLITTDFAAPR